MFINRMYQRICRQLTLVELSSSETKKSTHRTLIFAIFDSFKRIFSTLRSWCVDLKVMIVNRKNDKVDKVANRIFNSSEDMGLQPEALSDVPERISPLTPHEVPLPSPTKEEFEWFKADAQDCNSQNSYLRFPIDIHTHILSYLTEPEDIKNTREVSVDLNQATIECLRARVYLAKKAIAEIIQFAQLFDREIQRITESINQEGNLVRESILEDTTLKTDPYISGYHRFKFDVKKWEKLLVDLGTKVGLATMTDKIKKDCRLDLVEALAEYNSIQTVQGKVKNLQDICIKDCFLSKINLSNISRDLTLDKRERMNQILDEAKSTAKGDLFVESLFLGFDCTLDTFNQKMVRVWLVLNRESHYQYPVMDIPFNWLIGKREGDRLLLFYSSDHRQILLHCFELRYRTQKTFEEAVITSLFYTNTVEIKIKNEFLEKIKKTYGNKLVDSVAKEVREQMVLSMNAGYLTPKSYNKMTCCLTWLDAHFSI